MTFYNFEKAFHEYNKKLLYNRFKTSISKIFMSRKDFYDMMNSPELTIYHTAPHTDAHVKGTNKRKYRNVPIYLVDESDVLEFTIDIDKEFS